MRNIISPKDLDETVFLLKENKKSIVLTGGCFDILHVGHIKFLKEAKKSGDLLFVLLESDKRVKNLKGYNKPYFHQRERAEVLASLSFVDYVILLPFFENDDKYNQLVEKIHPSVIAVTANDPILDKKKNQAKLVGGKVSIVPYIKTFSSSQIAKLLGLD